MMSHGFSRCAGRRVRCCGPCSACSGCSRISISRYAEVGRFGLAAAICRTVVALAFHRRHDGACADGLLTGVALVADAALLTGLLDITGGPFNPFIVMYVVYIWVGGRGDGTGVGGRRGRGLGDWVRMARGRSPARRPDRAPSTERLSHASLHDVVLGRRDCGTRRALRHARPEGARTTTGTARRGPRAGGPKRAIGVTDDACGRRGPRVIDAARDDCGCRRASSNEMPRR